MNQCGSKAKRITLSSPSNLTIVFAALCSTRLTTLPTSREPLQHVEDTLQVSPEAILRQHLALYLAGFAGEPNRPKKNRHHQRSCYGSPPFEVPNREEKLLAQQDQLRISAVEVLQVVQPQTERPCCFFKRYPRKKKVFKKTKETLELIKPHLGSK